MDKKMLPIGNSEKDSEGKKKSAEIKPRREFFQKIFALGIWFLFGLMSFLFLGYNPWIKTGIFVAAFSASFPFLVIIVPKVTGLVLFNFFKKEEELSPVGPGWHFKYPWETAQEDSYFSLKLVTKSFRQDYAAQDGPMMHIEASYQYLPDKKTLHIFIGVDDTTIQDGLKDMLSSLLSEAIAGENAIEARKGIKDIEKGVMERFEKLELLNGFTAKDKLEMQYGINFKLFTVSDIDFSEDYQNSRSAQARMAVFTKTVQDLVAGLKTEGSKGVDPKEAANIVLLEQGKSTEKKIIEVEGLVGATDAIKGIFGRKDG